MHHHWKKRLIYIVYLVAIILLLVTHPLIAREIGPEANLCVEINGIQPGEVLTLRPGDYRGPCRIRHGGFLGSPIVIEGQSSTERPRIVYEGQSSNVFEIDADYVTLRGLKIGPTKRNIDGVRILARAGITIEDCEFSGLGGIAIAATRNSADGLTVRRNIVTDSAATAMYFGCHDGISCQISHLLVERNFIRGVDAPDPEIGYGIQVKLNSAGVIRDNVIVDTKGPAIMVYGATDEDKVNVVERNFVAGSRTSSGILIGGGPALVRNNIASSNFEGGITLQDYADRGLLRKITIVHNTTFKNNVDEVIVPSHARLTDVLLANNATRAKEGHRALPSDRSGLVLRGNIDCSAAACFVDPEGRNFSPLASSPLKRAGETGDALSPADDFYGRRRGGSVVAGAVGLPGPPIMLGIKSDL